MDYTKYKVTADYSNREKYREEVRKVGEQFEHDLYEHLGIADNPKRKKLFSIAWELGHSCGYQEVAIYAKDLVELIL